MAHARTHRIRGARLAASEEETVGTRIHLTGELLVETEADGATVRAGDLPGRQGRLAFARLVLDPHPVARDELADLIWGDDLPKSWERDLSAVISKIKSLLVPVGLGDALVSALGWYQLRLPTDARVDVEEARTSVEAAETALRAEDLPVALGAASVAANLARRPFLPGEQTDWVEGRRTELRHLLLRALDVLVEGHGRRGAHAEAIRFATEQLEVEPFRETAYTALVRLNVAAGNRAEALRIYERARRLLGEELGVPPSSVLESAYLDAVRADLVVPDRPRGLGGTIYLLVTDLVGSAELTEQLGVRAAESLRRAHFLLVRDTVGAYGRHEVKNLGDAVLATFDGSADALHGAIAIQQAAAAHNRQEGSPHLHVRVALHVGDPIVGEDDYFGMPVVITKRLCTAAGGGEILVSGVARALMRPATTTEFIGAGTFELRGLDEPIEVFRIAWGTRLQEPLPLPPMVAQAVDALPMVDRTELLDAIDATPNSAGQTRLTLLVGESGTGKSELAAAFARRSHDLGATVLWGRCDDVGTTPFQPIVEVLEQATSVLPDDLLLSCAGRGGAELARLLPALADRLRRPASAPTADLGADRTRMFDSVTNFLHALATQRPLVLVVDDLHWADLSTVQLLRRLLQHRGPGDVLVLATHRATGLDPSNPLTPALDSLRRGPNVTPLTVPGLTEVELASLFIGTALADRRRIVRSLHERTDGNPLFVKEIIRRLIDTGSIGLVDGQLVIHRPPDRVEIPESVKDVIRQRLALLSDETKEVLRSAAVIGPTFDLELLALVAGREEEAVLDAVENAAVTGIVVEAPGALDVFAFTHALLRETLYEDITTSRRVRLHERIAESLEARGPDVVNQRISEVAYHFAAGARRGDPTRALRYSIQAAHRAIASFAFDEAVEHATRALEFTDDSQARLEILLLRGDALLAAGHTSEAFEVLHAASDLAAKLDHKEGLVAAARSYWSLPVWVSGPRFDDPGMALRVVERALASLGSEDPADRARLLGFKAMYLMSEDWHGAQTVASEARAIAERLDDPVVKLEVLAWTMLAVHDGLAATRPAAAQLIDEAQRIGRHDIELWGYLYLMEALVDEPDLAGADATQSRFESRVAELQLRAHGWWIPLWRAMRAFVAGRFGDAEHYSAEAFDIGLEPLGVEVAGSYFFTQRYQLRHEQDRLGELAPMLDAWLDRPADGVVPPDVLTIGRVMLAVAHASEGRVVEARSLLGPGTIPELIESPNRLTYQHTLIHATNAAVALDDVDGARLVRDAMLPYRHRVARTGWATAVLGPFALHLGRLACVLGDFDAAEEDFRLSMERSAALASPVFTAHTKYEWGRMLRLRGRPADRPLADELLLAAKEAASTVGMTRLARLADAALDQ